jgi:hypothetical protein
MDHLPLAIGRPQVVGRYSVYDIPGISTTMLLPRVRAACEPSHHWVVGYYEFKRRWKQLCPLSFWPPSYGFAHNESVFGIGGFESRI